MRVTTLPLLALALCYLGNGLAPGADNTAGADDPYLPKLRVTLRNDRTGEPYTAYRFTDDQLARMARTKLDAKRVIAYLERTWTVERLRAFCTKEHVMQKDVQNLVAQKIPVEADLHSGAAHGFDRISFYVGDEDGQETYPASLVKTFYRWTYSINVKRGEDHWTIIESLPNDFMDSPKYDLQ